MGLGVILLKVDGHLEERKQWWNRTGEQGQESFEGKKDRQPVSYYPLLPHHPAPLLMSNQT
jgi:hypothetical protein